MKHVQACSYHEIRPSLVNMKLCPNQRLNQILINREIIPFNLENTIENAQKWYSFSIFILTQVSIYGERVQLILKFKEDYKIR